MKNGLFETPREWWEYFYDGAQSFICGLEDIAVSIFMGIASVIAYLWKQAVRFVGSYPSFALGGFIVIAAVVWILTFVSLKARAVGAEAQRDSISWEYSQFKIKHGYEDNTLVDEYTR